MDLVYFIAIFACGVAAAFFIVKLQDENLFGNKSAIATEFRNLKNKNLELEKTLNGNIQTIATANKNILDLKKDIACYIEKINKNDTEIDNLQEHCAKLRESLINVKEILASKRPIHKHEAITVTLTPGVFKASDVKKVKSQMKELEK